MLVLAYLALGAIFFLLGASIYSFLGVVVCRVPRGESVLRGRSRCDACGKTLSAMELVPCVSFLALRGRCRGCGGKIPLRSFFSELFGGALCVFCAFFFADEPARGALYFACACVLSVVALVDFDTMEIWNGSCIALAALGLAAVWVCPETGLVSRLIGALCISVPMLLVALCIPGGFGGGDIKLMAAAGWLLGWKGAVAAAFFALLGGGGYGAILLARRKAGRKTQFAFGPFLAAGILLALFCGSAVMNWYLGLFL